MKISIKSGRLFIFINFFKKSHSVRILNAEFGFLRNDKDYGNYYEYCIEIKLDVISNKTFIINIITNN